MAANRTKEIKVLEKYFLRKPEVLFAFLFGSQAKKVHGKISDWDIAAYISPKDKHSQTEWEETSKLYPSENKIWNDLVDILKTDNVDLVVLNRAPANIADSALRGTPLVIKNRLLFLDYLLRIRRQAEDYRQFVDDYYEILQRSG